MAAIRWIDGNQSDTSPQGGPVTIHSQSLNAAMPDAQPVFPAEDALQQLQTEMDSLHEEIRFLRQRDEALNYYMRRLDEELRLAAKLQQDFLPKNLPQVGRVHFHVLYRPAGYVSGDLYDVHRLDESHIGFYMTDAVGHGVPAALLTMFLKNALVTKEIGPAGYRLLTPGEVLGKLNNTLAEQNLAHATFATAVYGTINIKTYACSLARAGHPPPLVMRADGSVSTIEADGGLLGIFPNEKYDNRAVQLEPGDRIFLFSDGIEVAFGQDSSGDGLHWKRELMRMHKLPTNELLTELAAAIDNETGSLEPKDDLSLLVVEVR